MSNNNNIFVCLDDLPQNRLAVKTTPTMQLQAVLEQACTKFQLNPLEWGLRYKKALVDLTLPLRFSPVPPGSRLDLCRLSAAQQQKAGNGGSAAANAVPINVAVQLDEVVGGRVTDRFPSDTTIWQVLLSTEAKSQGQLNLTRRTAVSSTKTGKLSAAFSSLIKGGSSNVNNNNNNSELQEPYIMPVCLVMSREYATIDQLQSTTLRQAGLSGSGVIRVMFRPTDYSLASVLPQIERVGLLSPVAEHNKALPSPRITSAVNAPVDESSVATSHQTETLTFTPSEIQTPLNNAALQDASSSSPSLSSPSLSSQMDRQARLFRIPDGQSAAKIELPDSFFELSSSELKFAAQLATARRRAEEERPLMTKAMREKADADRERRYPKTMIRIRFPDGPSLLQGSFLTAEKVRAIYEFVCQFMEDPSAPFYLYMTPPMQKLVGVEMLDKNLFQAQLAPATLLHFMAEHPSARLSPSALERLEELAPHRSLTEWLGDDGAKASIQQQLQQQSGASELPENGKESDGRHLSQQRPPSGSGRSANVPKWFKMPLRK